MARQKFEKSFNTFVKGLMTEASEINFPENYSLYEKNFELRRDGGRDRRKGMDLLYPLGLTLTSKLYPLEFSDGIGVDPLAPSIGFSVPPMDIMGVLPVVPMVSVTSTVRYIEYDGYGPETIAIEPVAPEVKVASQVRNLIYEGYLPEVLDVVPTEPVINVETVAARLEYVIEPEGLDLSATLPTVKVTTT